MQPRFAALLFALGLVDLAIVNLGLGPEVFANTPAEAKPAPSSLPARAVADVDAHSTPPSPTPVQSREARSDLPPAAVNSDVTPPSALPPSPAPSAVPLQAAPLPAPTAPAAAPSAASAAQAVAQPEAHTSTVDVTVAFPLTATALLTPEARGELLRLAARMRDDPSHRMRIIGHADARGSREFNRFLGNRRARVVSELLVAAGVPREQLEIESRGEDQPRELGSTEEAWAANRRVEISIGSEGSKIP
jgi:outer membrane protein OmpA-like peptidoglycan-associated protein